MKKILIGIMGVLWGGFIHAQQNELNKGDLIFVKEGKSEFSKAITDATGKGDSVRFVHVGIIDIKENGAYYVIEASPEEGVREIPLKRFMEENKEIVMKRVSVTFPIEETLSRAKEHLGEEYDWWYLPGNGKMYCSELIYESYLDKEGNHLFEAKPMNFRATDGTIPDFWIKLYEDLGEPIPEGVEGTNPNDLFQSPLLQTL